MDHTTIQLFCRENAENQAKEDFSDILYELNDTRKQKNNILGYFSYLFYIHPNILRIGQPKWEFHYMCVKQYFFDILTECNDIFQDLPFNLSYTRTVIIGINTYIEKPLSYTVHYVLCFKDYLITCAVSYNHICLLTDAVNNGSAFHST